METYKETTIEELKKGLVDESLVKVLASPMTAKEDNGTTICLLAKSGHVISGEVPERAGHDLSRGSVYTIEGQWQEGKLTVHGTNEEYKIGSFERKTNNGKSLYKKE